MKPKIVIHNHYQRPARDAQSKPSIREISQQYEAGQISRNKAYQALQKMGLSAAEIRDALGDTDSGSRDAALQKPYLSSSRGKWTLMDMHGHEVISSPDRESLVKAWHKEMDAYYRAQEAR